MYNRAASKLLYKTSCDKISAILNVFNIQTATGNYILPNPSQYLSIINLAKEILFAHSQEEENCYKTTILAISEWLIAAMDEHYIKANHSEGFPSIEYVIHKGFEVIHCLLYRDLRRRQFALTESQLVQEFVALASQYPNPCETHIPAHSSTTRQTS